MLFLMSVELPMFPDLQLLVAATGIDCFALEKEKCFPNNKYAFSKEQVRSASKLHSSYK